MDPNTNQPRFDMVYVLNNNYRPTKESPTMSLYLSKTKNVSFHINVPNAQRNLMFEKEAIEQLKKQKMSASSNPKVEEIIRDPLAALWIQSEKSAKYDEVCRLWSVKTVSTSVTTMSSEVEYIGRWLVVATTENADRAIYDENRRFTKLWWSSYSRL
ncbi:probable indole-3-pyruvate monooxygenase YUCCA8 [Olea europaea subsp. europaea]|uniref:Probable indole-3-pyruvate monooxygenase YUCCA8 n=1 Tax=Olea europaea subsp. europaea TaxID=158383 RepID=A0A8S0R1H0_OLEEU|nr:probable indole-3-pyruvate monooxygenase YUCCA8 [Olea europaea subsp. europaea]